MKCPHCGKDIKDGVLSKYLGSKGGAKSKRTLTKEQAREMVRKRKEKKYSSSLVQVNQNKTP